MVCYTNIDATLPVVLKQMHDWNKNMNEVEQKRTIQYNTFALEATGSVELLLCGTCPHIQQPMD